MAFDWGGALSGAGTGAATGATLGGPWGALSGGAIGGLGGGFANSLSKSGSSKGDNGFSKVSLFNPQQESAFQRLLQQLGGAGGIGDQSSDYFRQLLSGSDEAYKNFEAPYMRQFQEQTVPALAERFAGVGGLSSSGFQQSLGQAGAGLSENLASLREGLRGNAAQQGMSGLHNLLGMTTQAYLPQQLSMLKQLLVGLAPGIGSGLGQFAGSYAAKKWG